MSNKSGPIRTTSYSSIPIPIPDSFLSSPPPHPPTVRPVLFTPNLPEYAPHKAFLVSDALTPDECQQLIALAEQANPGGWAQALVSLGPGLEAAMPAYRNSERIIWDRREVVDRIWGRCLLAEGVGGLMEGKVPGEVCTDSRGNMRSKGGRWVFRGLNERMRFLRYQPGGFFKPHCDAHYFATVEGKTVETFYTLHLYLNHEGLEGGATAFLSRDGKRRVDVDPVTGSVLVFQHDGLFHEGAEVKAGVKYTMRTDVMYTWEAGA